MQYPTLEQVEQADRRQLCIWSRFLPSPGMSAIGTDKFQEVLDAEAPINKRIGQRLQELGGFTPEISKEIGWEE